MKKIAVIGAGGTGVALSAILASKGHEVYLTDNLNQTVVEAAQEAGSRSFAYEGHEGLRGAPCTRHFQH